MAVFTYTASLAASFSWKNVKGLAEASTSSIITVEVMTTR